MSERILHSIRLTVTVLLMTAAGFGYAQQPAAITADKATRVTDTTLLTVQSGGNYVRIEPDYLPATIVYMTDAMFGPVPTAMLLAEDTIPAERFFEDCRSMWRWSVSEAEKSRIIEVRAHESALIRVEPYVCQATYSDTTAAECFGYEWRGEWYDESGDYPITLVNAAGCDSIRTLHLTIYKPEDTDSIADAWDSIVWYGSTYTESGSYPIELNDEHGCAYTHTLVLTVHTTYRDTNIVSECDSMEYQEKIYRETGLYTVDTTYADGDRTIHFLDLTLGETIREQKEVTDWCGRYEAPSGAIYTESGVYNDTVYQQDGCPSILILTLRYKEDCTIYDTVYFCAGYNTEHLERTDDEHATRYIAYQYESPAEWNYMDGVIVSKEAERALVDLRRAEQNLYTHYVDSLSPVKSIVWTYRERTGSSYGVIEVKDEPQWLETGVVALTVRFVCGQMYTSDFTTDMLQAMTDGTPVKRIENGQVIILRGGRKYNLLGSTIE